MTTITREQLRERAREKVKSLEFAVTQTAFSENRAELEEELELARIALASLEAEPVAWAHRLINKRNGVVHPWVYGSAEACPSEGDIFNIEVMPLYTAPPAPVAVPECFKRLLHHAYGMTMGHDWNKGTMAGHHRAKLCQAVDECRAAMLQGADGTLTNEGTMQLSGNSEQIEPVSNRDELPLDYLQGHKDGLEWAAQLAEANHPQTGDWLYDDQIDLAMAIRKGPDMPTVQGGNSPVIPDGWVMVPVELTPDMRAAWDSAPYTDDDDNDMQAAYRAMIAAAPQWKVK
ncbi:hypothetical protein [Escherichia coli]|uniref:hypothetical protein n=2 Tax=Escherichia coli TaxID=562 RepID=UPI000CBFCDD1|nr:hypothetical protein [Escherichia coli]MBL9241607.1 hypothetical protein [Escherichia coli]MBL9250674.1 hypothetical protein [Escherichia coli]OZO56339.1 hypothetical protein CG693_25300 [Escherichia coli]OZO71229.1 hypothetical protein CG695_25345 [Escherichia coli]OZO76142.1 hypothetical protein CG704_25555 [Escherichia coli]